MIHMLSSIRGYRALPLFRLPGGTLLLLGLIITILVVFNGWESSALALSPTPTPSSHNVAAPGMTGGTSQAGNAGQASPKTGFPSQSLPGEAGQTTGGSNSGTGGSNNWGSAPYQGPQGMPQGTYGGTGDSLTPSSLPGGLVLKDSMGFKYENELRQLYQNLSYFSMNRKLKLSDVQKRKLIFIARGLSGRAEALGSVESSMDKVFDKSQRILIKHNPVNGYYYIPSLSSETDRRKISEDDVLRRVITLLEKKCAP